MIDINTAYIMVATLERDVVNVSVHANHEDAIQAANGELVARMKTTGNNPDDEDVQDDEGTGWAYADEENDLAYCDYNGNFDAHVIRLAEYLDESGD